MPKILIDLCLRVYRDDELIDEADCDDETVGRHIQHMLLKHGTNVRMTVRAF
jgi:hypothetical protein